ncbi:MAG: lysophospholipid acyltransferase family protein, partial [Chlamydiae bacterium]|nr:lysophospholipid acyltransferase family protein [Chlamydiota bacterium]
FLYRWITSIRERFGGMMITPKQAMREGFRALKQGKFLGIVGDQGMPESGFLSTFLGRRAWTSPAPAILAYRAKCPLMVATTVRKKGKYYIHYSDPLYPDLTLPLEEETAFLMQKALRLFEESVKKNPEQWLWQHNRWKQETPKTVYYKYRHDSLLILLPQDMTSLLPHLSVFREIYPSAFMTFMLPKNAPLLPLQDVEKIYYEKDSELFLQDLRYKLVFNLTPLKGLKHHFLKQSAFQVLALKDLYALAKKHPVSSEEPPLSDILKRALCRPNTLWTTGNASQ